VKQHQLLLLCGFRTAHDDTL